MHLAFGWRVAYLTMIATIAVDLDHLLADPVTKLEGNPYRAWIEMYGGSEYQDVAGAAVAQLQAVAARRLGDNLAASPRWPDLTETFRTATRLEVGFWNMGLNPK